MTESYKVDKGGAGKPASPDGPTDRLEALEALLANLFIMQVMAVAKLDAIQDILQVKGLLTQQDLEAINHDVTDAVSEHGGSPDLG